MIKSLYDQKVLLFFVIAFCALIIGIIVYIQINYHPIVFNCITRDATICTDANGNVIGVTPYAMPEKSIPSEATSISKDYGTAITKVQRFH